MTNMVVCTICSREKDKSPGLIPARRRYQGAHVAYAAKLAEERGLPLFFLSGLKGFISADALIENYDHLLLEEEVEELARTVRWQLAREGVTEIRFYYMPKEGWRPYRHALMRATAGSAITLQTFMPEMAA